MHRRQLILALGALVGTFSRDGNSKLKRHSVTAAPQDDTARLAFKVSSLVGPYIPTSQSARMGGVFARYESDFMKYDEPQWNWCNRATPTLWMNGNCNYYDRAMIYYVWWQRTGNPKYLERANRTALRFRQEYVEPNGYGVVTHWAMMDGLALHYLVTGDQASLKAVGQVADIFAWGVMSPDPNVTKYIDNPAQQDNRIQAYAIKSILLAYKLHAPSTGTRSGHPGGNDWAAVLRRALNKILATRDPDGQWRGARCGTAGRATHPFTVGLLYDSLIRYYELFEADPRIPQAIQRSAEVMWQQDWLPGAKAFKYVAVPCPGEGGPNPAPDLNNLILNGYAWTYKKTGEPAWGTRADQIFAGSVIHDSPSTGAKQFNQSYTSSYRYLSWRFAQ